MRARIVEEVVSNHVRALLLARATVLLPVLFVACGQENVVPDQPIVIVPDAEIDGRHRQATEFAAESWNLEFGTRISVADDAGDAQAVSLSWWQGECAFDDGFVFAAFVPEPRVPEINMCPKYTRDKHPDFFETVRHEIGHVLGLEHGRDPFAVMGVPDDPSDSGALRRLFRPEDRREFVRTNRSFAGLGGCSINQLTAENVGKGAIVASSDVPYAVWDQESEILFAPIDLSTGERPSEAMTVSTTSTLSALGAHPTADGFVVSWAEQNGLHRAFVSMTGEISSPQLLPIQWDKRSQYVSSDVFAGSSHYLGLSSYSSGTTRLLEVGADGRVIGSTIGPDRGSLVYHDGLFLAGSTHIGQGTRRARVSRLERVGDQLVVREMLDLGETVEVDPEREPYFEPVSGFAASDGLLVIVDSADRTVMIRVATTGALLIAERVELDARLRFANIFDTGTELLVAGWRRSPEFYEWELVFASFDRKSLLIARDWTRVSSVDQFSGSMPSLFYSEGRLLLSWLEIGDLRTRCVLMQ